jgi:hypothetical protein
MYAEALRSVEDYLEAPYRVRRCDGSADARMRLTDHISDIQSLISYDNGLFDINGSRDVAQSFRVFVGAARREAGPQMTKAWETRPTKKDHEVPVRVKLRQLTSDAARAALHVAMKKRLASSSLVPVLSQERRAQCTGSAAGSDGLAWCVGYGKREGLPYDGAHGRATRH